MRSHRILALVVAAALAAGLAGASDTAANATPTAWQVFGNGSATGRGRYGSPEVGIDSTTQEDPVAIRYLVQGVPRRSVSVYWSIWCWNENSWDDVNASGSYDATLPITRRITQVTVTAWDYCQLDVSAYDFENGTLTVKLQAQYEA